MIAKQTFSFYSYSLRDPKHRDILVKLWSEELSRIALSMDSLFPILVASMYQFVQELGCNKTVEQVLDYMRRDLASKVNPDRLCFFFLDGSRQVSPNEYAPVDRFSTKRFDVRIYYAFGNGEGERIRTEPGVMNIEELLLHVKRLG